MRFPHPPARPRGTVHRRVRSSGCSRLATLSILGIALIFSPAPTRAQEISSDAPAQPQSSNSTYSRMSHSAIAPEDLDVSWRKMPARFLHDQKDMWLFPTKLGERKAWITTAIVVGGTAVFVKEDPPLKRNVRQTDIFTQYYKSLKRST